MKTSDPHTPLLALLRALSDEQREQLASDAGTTVSYLYALATCQRTGCRVKLAVAIATASERMADQTLGLTPIVTVQELGSMCPVPTAK